jgi:hypothetical protein
MISKQLLAELKIILKEEYGIEFSDEDVAEFGECLVNCFKILGDKGETRNG